MDNDELQINPEPTEEDYLPGGSEWNKVWAMIDSLDPETRAMVAYTFLDSGLGNRDLWAQEFKRRGYGFID